MGRFAWLANGLVKMRIGGSTFQVMAPLAENESLQNPQETYIQKLADMQEQEGDQI